MNRVSITCTTRALSRWERPVRSVLLSSMRRLRLRSAEVSVALLNDREMRELNRRHRGLNRPTDVLSFEQPSVPGYPRRILGDIAISVPTALENAKALDLPGRDEIARLAVHGLLHLLGHDHAEPAKARNMLCIEERLLKKGSKQ